MRGKQSVRKGIWYVGGEKSQYRKQRGRGILFRLVASAAAPFLGKVAKPLLKNFFGGRCSRRRR